MGYDEISIIKQSIAHEYEGYDYYIAQSKKWNSEEVCNVFASLAEDELKHVKWLEELFTAKTEGLSKRVLKLVDEITPPDIFDWSNVKNFRFEDLKVVFLHIMELELEASNFYKEASENATDEATKEIFNKLSAWELTHYHLFKDEYDKV